MPDQNLVAIDVVMDNVVRVREEGSPALKGDMIDLLWSWPEDRPVCAVLMDFCSGTEWGNGGAYDAFETKPLRNAAVMVNFMRGRDRWSNEIRENLDRAGLLSRSGVRRFPKTSQNWWLKTRRTELFNT